jgi:hypothetical protein
MVKVTKAKFEAKDVFGEFRDDTVEVLHQMQTYDNKVIRYQEVCNNDERDMTKTQAKVAKIYE